ncbi:protease [Streptomyces sulfonofaciens]|uniref:Protease n=1 Tax=Streptomyces sulfonofaciens TaxID=68272 RepID=A0A919LA76_9ACTN|nr:trypsin-like peptidase domain-containing protein [Streptomyces sulfonofaciens]GHH87911.1 protease [Streptomyces sulfonofaciens]
MTESFPNSGEYSDDTQSPYQGPAYVHPGQQQSSSYGAAGGAYPPPPGYEPVPGAHHAPPARRRTRTPFALLAAVALAAGVVGGGAAYAVQAATGGHDTAQTAVSGTPVAADSRGTVSGVAAAVSPSIVEVSASVPGGQSTGSGVILTGDGEILTNNHVVSGASQVRARTSNGKSYNAEVVGTDPKKDLALVKLDGATGLKAATLGDSNGLKVGDQVVAIGSPEGLTGTVTSGIVSALDRDVTVPVEDQQQGQGQGAPWQQGGGGSWPFEFGGQQFNGDTGSSKTTYKAIQTDASLNPGNSGGALINMSGQIVGINSAMYSPASADSSSSSDAGSVGLGFAIPINTVKADLDQLRSGGADG